MGPIFLSLRVSRPLLFRKVPAGSPSFLSAVPTVQSDRSFLAISFLLPPFTTMFTKRYVYQLEFLTVFRITAYCFEQPTSQKPFFERSHLSLPPSLQLYCKSSLANNKLKRKPNRSSYRSNQDAIGRIAIDFIEKIFIIVNRIIRIGGLRSGTSFNQD